VTINNAEILAYVLDNRLHLEDGEYLLQERVSTMGRDAVSSAFAWIWGRFFHAGRGDIFSAWKTATYDDLEAADLVNLDTIRAKYVANGVDSDLVDMYVMLFDSLVQLSVSNIWQDSQMADEGKQSKKEAQELISAIIGNDANPLGGSGDGAGSSQDMDQLGEASVEVCALSAEDIKTELGGYE